MKSHVTRVLLALSLLALSLASGCEKLECQPGTLQDGDTCVASQESRCPDNAELDGMGKCILKGSEGLKCGAGTYNNGSGECVGNARLDGNASRIYSMTLSKPTGIADLANPILQNDFASGTSMVFIGALAVGDGLRIWGGIDDRASPFNVIVPASAYNVPATGTASAFAASVPFYGIQILGADTALVNTELTAGVLDQLGPLTVVKSYHLEGILTMENADLVYIEQAALSLKDFIMNQQPPDADADGDGTKDGWILTADVTTELAWAYER